MIFQTYLSRKMVPAVNGRVVVYIRAALSMLTLILTITTISAGYISMLEFQGIISPPKRATLLRLTR